MQDPAIMAALRSLRAGQATAPQASQITLTTQYHVMVIADNGFLVVELAHDMPESMRDLATARIKDHIDQIIELTTCHL